MSSFKTITWPFATLGVILSLYALYVEYKISHKNPDEDEFSALCDIESIGASCSSAFAMPEGKLVSYFGIVPQGHLLDVPNAFIGLVYYTYWLALRPIFPVPMTAMVSTLAMTASVFLAYKLLVLHELCILCWSTHIINLRLLLRAYNNVGESKEPVLKEPPKIKRI
ncbi:unnamed protein product [Cylindrotheca closterium]|uniref:vitamin-K-epoxide reductase (warfarin-sensitive) n=1 Tax=Cylindrotheca closterium TaxID=2856 RepID=A0AAD2G664_9STRA|nr:unnamed protein product [Cylindrotheca closterium]